MLMMKSSNVFRLLALPALCCAILPRATTAVWQPAVGSKFQIMLSAVPKVDSSLVPINATVYDVDLFDTPKSTITALKAKGISVICYFSAGTAEDWRSDYKSFKSTDLGNALPEWEGEVFVNIKSTSVVNIMKARIRTAASKGCNGIDPDNMGKNH
jgi:hypothetical protein